MTTMSPCSMLLVISTQKQLSFFFFLTKKATVLIEQAPYKYTIPTPKWDVTKNNKTKKADPNKEKKQSTT